MAPRLIIVFIMLASLLAPAQALADDVIIIANKSVPVSSLGADDIKQIFLGQKTTWNDGTKINFVVQDRTKASNAFLKTYLQKTATQYDKFWKIQVFTGKGRAPRSYSSSFELIQFVSQTPGAISYVSAGTNIGDLKVIAVH